MTLLSHRIASALLSFVMGLASSVTRADDLAPRVAVLEAKAAHLQSLDQSFRMLVSQGIENLVRKKQGTVDGLQLIEVIKLNKKAAEDILAESENIRAEAVQIIKEGRNTFKFSTVQEGETASQGDRVLAILQLARCVTFTTELVSLHQYVSEAQSLAISVADGCKHLVSTLRHEPVSKASKKQKSQSKP